ALHGEGYLEETPRFVASGEREAYAVAARLTQLFADPPTVYDENAETYRDARPEDVSILLRSRTRLKAYERALDEFDVPYAVTSGTGFYDSTEVIAVLNLLRVLENQRNERALYGVLRSPLFGIEDDAVAKLCLTDGNLWDALRAADGDLGDAYDCLQRWRRLAGTHPEVDAKSATPWGTLLSRVIEETGYLASLAGDERPRQAAVNVNRLREQLRTWEEAGVKTAAGIVDRLETRCDIESHADEATIPEDAEAVEIRTIHSAKGLEFPIVVVPELGTEFNFQADVDDDGKVYLDEFDLTGTGGRDPVLGIKSPSRGDAFVSDDTLVRRVTRDRMQRYERAELKRLLYVATTRTRDHLLLSGVHNIEERDDGFVLAEPNDAVEANCWRDWLQPVLLDDLPLSTLANGGAWTNTLDESTYRVSRPVAPVDDWGRVRSRTESSLSIDVPSIERRSPRTTVTASGYADLVASDGDDHASAGERDYDQDGDDDLHRGTLGTIVHRVAERRPDREYWPEFARNVATRENETLADADLERILRDAARAIEFVDDYEAGLENPTSYDELSVTARFDGVQVIGDIDHLVVTDEAYHVLDYKTNAIETMGVDALADYYWPQLKAYAAALHQSDPNREVHLVLYFTNCDESRVRSFALTDLDSLGASVRDTILGEV
ncbi:MAG: UvrD-helicase domain-containing protein, partial [Halobacteriota archaeon]